MTNQARPIDDDTDDQAVAKPPVRRVAWTKKVKRAFLDHLAESGNVSASARAVGMDPTGVQHLRRRDPAFAGEWATALEVGYVMIETRLVGHILAGGSRDQRIAPAGDHAEQIHVDDALRVLGVRDSRRARGNVSNAGALPLRASREETDAALLKQLRITARRAEKG